MYRNQPEPFPLRHPDAFRRHVYRDDPTATKPSPWNELPDWVHYVGRRNAACRHLRQQRLEYEVVLFGQELHLYVGPSGKEAGQMPGRVDPGKATPEDDHTGHSTRHARPAVG